MALEQACRSGLSTGLQGPGGGLGAGREGGSKPQAWRLRATVSCTSARPRGYWDSL